MNNKYVYMMGGLGNQMFIYAFSRFLQRNGEKVYLITTSFHRDALRDYKLHHYDILLPRAKGLNAFVGDKRIRLGVRGIFSRNVYSDPSGLEYIDKKKTKSYKYFMDIF